MPTDPTKHAGDGAPPRKPRSVFIRQAIEACGMAPLARPEPDAVRSALRRIIDALLIEAWDKLPGDPRFWVSWIGKTPEPRMARYHLAVALTERPMRPWDHVSRDEAGRRVRAPKWKPDDDELAFIGDPYPDQTPTLPSSLVGAALILLALLDVKAVATREVEYQGDFTAYNVLRRVAGDHRWQEDLRDAMSHVLDGVVEDEAAFALAVVALSKSPLPAQWGEAPDGPGTYAGAQPPSNASKRELKTPGTRAKRDGAPEIIAKTAKKRQPSVVVYEDLQRALVSETGSCVKNITDAVQRAVRYHPNQLRRAKDPDGNQGVQWSGDA